MHFRIASREFVVEDGEMVYRIGVALGQCGTIWYGQGASYGEAVDNAAHEAIVRGTSWLLPDPPVTMTVEGKTGDERLLGIHVGNRGERP